MPDQSGRLNEAELLADIEQLEAKLKVPEREGMRPDGSRPTFARSHAKTQTHIKSRLAERRRELEQLRNPEPEPSPAPPPEP